MKSYRVTCLFQTDWPNLIPALFGDQQPISCQIGGNVGIFNFEAPISLNNLGPLVIIEESSQSFLFE
jgi:hypothetical protein